MRFELDEIPRLLNDPAVAAGSRAAAEAVFAGSARPLATAAPLRAAAFACSIQGLACRLAPLQDLAILPHELADHILTEAEGTRLRGRKIVERAREVLAILSAADADVIPLKGCALVLRGDVDAALRPMGDLDLLVADLSRFAAAAAVLERETAYRPVLSTERHLVFAEADERVPAPAGEHPGNPIRVELHRSFRLPVLGIRLDATGQLRGEAARSRDGFLLPSDGALLRHLWHHAAEDFAARGLRGIQALDFRDRAPVRADLDPRDRGGAAPLLYAADAIERLFRGTFDRASVEELAAHVPATLRVRAAALPVLRHTRPPRGWTKISLGLASGPAAKARFFLRTAFPSPGEVKANIAPGASGFALALAWLRVLARRALGLFR